MRMDENSNPEWKQMLRGSSAGRKALETIADLEQQLAEISECEQCDNHFDIGFCPVCWNALAKRMLDAETQLAECQQERDAMREAMQIASNELGIGYKSFDHGLPQPIANASEILENALAATKENEK